MGRLFCMVMLTKDNSSSTETLNVGTVFHTTKTQELTPECTKHNFTLMIGPTHVEMFAESSPMLFLWFNFHKVLPDEIDFALRLPLEKYVSSQRLYYQILEFSRQKKK